MLYRFNGRSPVIEEGAFVHETAVVVGDVKIAAGCYVGYGAIIRGDHGSIEIGYGTAVEEGVIIHAGPDEQVKIGKRVTFGHSAIIHSHIIEDDVVIGMGAVTSLDSIVGKGSIVAEGAVVKRGQVIEPNVMAAGTPARVIREIQQKDLDLWNYGKQLYIDLAASCLEKGMLERID